MNADGSNVRRLTTAPGYDGGPFFSPDGQRIVWRHFDESGVIADVCTMKLDGSDKKRVTDFKSMSWAPFYHPSGKYVIFTSNKLGFANFELFLVDAEGEHEPVRVTFTPGFDGLPVFSPDGKKLCWTSGRTADGKSQFFLADWNHEAALAALDGAPRQERNAPFAASPTGRDRRARLQRRNHGGRSAAASRMPRGRETGRADDRQPGRRSRSEVARGLLPASRVEIVRGEFHVSVRIQCRREGVAGKNAPRPHWADDQTSASRKAREGFSSARFHREWRSERRSRFCRLRAGRSGRSRGGLRFVRRARREGQDRAGPSLRAGGRRSGAARAAESLRRVALQGDAGARASARRACWSSPDRIRRTPANLFP